MPNHPSGDASDCHQWKLVTEYELASYPCGVIAGERVVLRRELIIKDHQDRPTGKSHAAGETWTVLRGVLDEPTAVWLREPNGDLHTWENESIWELFERAP